MLCKDFIILDSFIIGTQCIASMEPIKEKLQQVDGNLDDDGLIYKYV